MALLIKFGDTYYCKYKGSTQNRIYNPGLITIYDPMIVSFVPTQHLSSHLVQYQPYPKGPTKDFHWIDPSHIRYAEPADFTIGDIVEENIACIGEVYEIVDIQSSFRAGVSDPPITAEQLNLDGTRNGIRVKFEPHELIMVEPVNEPTLDMYIEKGPEPRNNDGRKRCYWCRGKVKRSQGFHLDWYDVCTQCGR